MTMKLSKMDIYADKDRFLDEPGHALVLGGPGSGKTTIALKKAIVRVEQGLSPGQSVLFLSFSRAAVARVIEAATEWVPQECMNRISIQTFHSFFWSIIKTHGYLIGSPRKLSILLPHDERAINKGIKSDNAEWVQWMEERERLFYEEGRVAFDLFSSKALKLLSESSRINNLVTSKHPLIIIDEAQDTDEKQWASARMLATQSQLVCLADLEQQIYDFREGISAERITDILDQLNPLRIDLGGENNRSPDSEILQCGNDILSSSPKVSGYNGVSRQLYNPKKATRDLAIRSSVGRVIKNIANETAGKPENIAILTSTNRGVTIVVNALRGDGDQKPIPHKILFDQTKALLSSRLIAFLLEPKDKNNVLENKAVFLELLRDVFQSKGTKTSQDKADRWNDYIEILNEGRDCRRTAFTKTVDKVLSDLGSHQFEGNPRKDWLYVRHLLRKEGNADLKEVESSVEYLMAFNRGKAISSGLAKNWQEKGNYSSARRVITMALTQDQLMSDDNDSSGLHVMTMHKSKGKQFDGVILFHEGNICSFTTYGDKAPYQKSRKLLRVAVTRARKHVFFLTDVFNPPEILEGFNF
ncbi:UvrD-helicase domain-containing protein [Vreelandella venusta]|nr:ATP-dependent helicase [Halomonas venusta]